MTVFRSLSHRALLVLTVMIKQIFAFLTRSVLLPRFAVGKVPLKVTMTKLYKSVYALTQSQTQWNSVTKLVSTRLFKLTLHQMIKSS